MIGPEPSQKFITLLASDTEFAQQVLEAGPTLCVCDIYSAYFGPCTALGKKLLNMSGDLMDYDVKWCEVKAEKCALFEGQRGKSRPLLALYKNGQEIDRMTEANPNVFERLVMQHAVKKPE